MGLAWAPSPHSSSSSSSSSSLPLSSPTSPLSPFSTSSVSSTKSPDLEYLLARMSTSQLPPPTVKEIPDSQTSVSGQTTIVDPKMNLRHYNVDPLLLSLSVRETLWPSLIIQRVYLGGEVPAHNYTVLSDYNVSHVVLCQRHHTCAHSPHVNYFQIPSESDFLNQIRAFVSFVESLSRSNYTILVTGQKGQNRSAGLVAGLVMRLGTLSVREACKLVMSRRTSVQFSDETLAALQKYERFIAGFASGE